MTWGPTRDSKYLPLGQYLADLDLAIDKVELTFGEIADIIEAPLPASAYRKSYWWSNCWGNRPSTIWLRAGWRVEQVGYEEEVVVFRCNRRPDQ